ncbi:MAG: hypothetical protein DHS20C10_13360 [marine bacterium B5-7]|nr:MAG: hypothetical protein DHS20C10_13360 [marine bacterium B5-7]
MSVYVDGEVRELDYQTAIAHYKVAAADVKKECYQIFSGWVYGETMPLGQVGKDTLQKKVTLLKRKKQLVLNDEENELKFIKQQNAAWEEAIAKSGQKQPVFSTQKLDKKVENKTGRRLPARFNQSDEQTKRRLLSARVSSRVVNEQGETLAHILARYGHSDTFLWLHQRNNKLAVQESVYGVRALDERHPVYGETMMHVLAKKGDLANVLLLLDCNPDLALRDKTVDGNLPLNSICIRRKPRQISIQEGDEDSPQSRQASLVEESHRFFGTTLLMQAYAEGKHDVFQKLLNYGADPMKIGLHGVTLLESISRFSNEKNTERRKNNARFLALISDHLIRTRLAALWNSGLTAIEERIRENHTAKDKEKRVLDEKHMPSTQLEVLRSVLAESLRDFLLGKYDSAIERFQRQHFRRIRFRYEMYFKDINTFFLTLKEAFEKGEPLKMHKAVSDRNSDLQIEPELGGLVAVSVVVGGNKRYLYKEESPLMKCLLPMVVRLKESMDIIDFEAVRKAMQAETAGDSEQRTVDGLRQAVEAKNAEHEKETAALRAQQAALRAQQVADRAAAEAREAAFRAEQEALRAEQKAAREQQAADRVAAERCEAALRAEFEQRIESVLVRVAAQGQAAPPQGGEPAGANRHLLMPAPLAAAAAVINDDVKAPATLVLQHSDNDGSS